MNESERNSKIDQLFKSAARLASRQKKWDRWGYSCDPCDPLLPINNPDAFYGEDKNKVKELIAKIITFVNDPVEDLLFLKAPTGSGKTVFSRIFVEYSRQLNIRACYQDASTFLDDVATRSQNLEDDVIFLDNAYYLPKILRKLPLLSKTSDSSPKLVALMSSAEFEAFRRHSIQLGDNGYQNFLPLYRFSTQDIHNLLLRRLQICHGDSLPSAFDNTLPDIATLSHGNPGIAIRILNEAIKFANTPEDLCVSFGIIPQALEEFTPSKIPILREILVREVQNDFLPPDNQKYLIHKELTTLLNKTKSTISHHLSDLINRNLLYEQVTADKRERAYRPNKSILGILEWHAFEASSSEESLLNLDVPRESM